MAKKITINGCIYRPMKFPGSEGWCSLCHHSLRPRTLVYQKVSENKDELWCLRCVNSWRQEHEKQLRANVLIFPVEETLYVGKKEHTCTENPIFDPLIARFSHKGQTFDIDIVRCTCCGKYLINGKVFQKHEYQFSEYILVRSNGNRKIYFSAGSSESTTLNSPKKAKIEIPSTVRWSVTHPYQGGKVSPK